MADEAYQLREQGLKTLQPLYEQATDRRTRGAMNRGINTLATSDPEDLFQRFPAVADAVTGEGDDLLKLLTKNEVTDTKFGAFGSGLGLEWHHRNMSLGELGKEARNLRPDVFRDFTLIFGDGGVKFGQNPAQMRIQAKPTHVPDGIRGNNWLTSHSAGKSPFRLPTWSASTTAAEAVADAKPIVADNIAQSDWAESLTPHKVTTDRLTDALGYNPLEGQENLSMTQRRDIGKELKKRDFQAFSVQEAQEWIANNQDALSKMKPKYLEQLGRLSASGGTIKVMTKIGPGVPLLGLGIGLGQAASAAQQGDYAGAAVHTAGAVIGEIPFAGDAINETISGSPVASAELKDAPRIQMGPKNVAAPTGNKEWDNSTQPFIQMLNGVKPKPKFKQTAIPALNF